MTLNAQALTKVADPELVRAAAKGFVDGGKGISQHANDVKQGWHALRAFYHAPEQELAFAAMDQPAKDASGLKGQTARIGKALNAYADDCVGLKARRKALIGREDRLNAQIAAAPDDPAGGADVQFLFQENALLGDMQRFESDLVDARIKCANAIYAAFGSTTRFVDADDPRAGTKGFKAADGLSLEGYKAASSTGKVDFGVPSKWTDLSKSTLFIEAAHGAGMSVYEFSEFMLTLKGYKGTDAQQALVTQTGQFGKDLAQASLNIPIAGPASRGASLGDLLSKLPDEAIAGLTVAPGGFALGWLAKQAKDGSHEAAGNRLKQQLGAYLQTWKTRPGYSAGGLLPDALLSIASAGAGGATKAATTLSKLSKLSAITAHKAGDLADIAKTLTRDTGNAISTSSRNALDNLHKTLTRGTPGPKPALAGPPDIPDRGAPKTDRPWKDFFLGKDADTGRPGPGTPGGGKSVVDSQDRLFEQYRAQHDPTPEAETALRRGKLVREEVPSTDGAPAKQQIVIGYRNGHRHDFELATKHAPPGTIIEYRNWRFRVPEGDGPLEYLGSRQHHVVEKVKTAFQSANKGDRFNAMLYRTTDASEVSMRDSTRT